MSKTIHIVCLDAPSPPDYGGAIDMYFKVKALAMAGNKIILHYFDYKETRSAGALQDICSEVYRYTRKSFLSSISLQLPYIVSSRINKELVNRLNQDEHPVLLEGLHCTGILPMLNNTARVVVRMHNEEENYYRSLYRSSTKITRKFYFLIETGLIKKYQQNLDHGIKMACLSRADMDKFAKMGFTNLHFIPCFIPWRQITSVPGKGDFCLYHGNMAVAENEKAALWLIENVFGPCGIPFVIAGNQITPQLEARAKTLGNIRLVKDPSIEKLEGLIREAHINVLPSMNTTGVKLKLLHALFGGRFCITNHEGLSGSGIINGVHIANTPGEYQGLVRELMHKNFQHAHIEERREISGIYNNHENAVRLSELW